MSVLVSYSSSQFTPLSRTPLAMVPGLSFGAEGTGISLPKPSFMACQFHSWRNSANKQQHKFRIMSFDPPSWVSSQSSSLEAGTGNRRAGQLALSQVGSRGDRGVDI